MLAQLIKAVRSRRPLAEQFVRELLVGEAVLEQPDVDDFPWVLVEEIALEPGDGPVDRVVHPLADGLRRLISQHYEGPLEHQRETLGNPRLQLANVLRVVGARQTLGANR